MPIHSAIFRQPGPELNPIRAKVPTPIAIEFSRSNTEPSTAITPAPEIGPLRSHYTDRAEDGRTPAGRLQGALSRCAAI